MTRAEGPHYPECTIEPCICRPLALCDQRARAEERVLLANRRAAWLYGGGDDAA